MMTSDQFYLQDSRQYVGNDVLWWAQGGKGYTTDLSKAHVYSKEEAQSRHNARRSDIPWPKDYIDQKTRPAVDMQYIKRNEALAGTGIIITPEPKPKHHPNRCGHCGCFISGGQVYFDCPKCGGENRP